MSFNSKNEGKFLNASPDCQEKAQQVYQYLYKTEDESETGEIIRAIVIAVVMFGLAIAIAFHYIGEQRVGNNGYSENNGYSGDEVYTPTTEDTDGETIEDAQSDNETLDYVDENNVTDYSNCLSPDDYATFETGVGDTVAYPKNFFTYVDGDAETVSFTASDVYPKYDIHIIAAENEDPIEEVKNKVSEYKGELENITYQYPSNESKIQVASDGYARTVLAGIWDASENVKAYYVIASDGADTKILEFKYEPDDYAQEDYSNQDYMIDCLYRGTSFTGSTYQMRTYDQFMNDDLGEKK